MGLFKLAPKPYWHILRFSELLCLMWHFQLILDISCDKHGLCHFFTKLWFSFLLAGKRNFLGPGLLKSSAFVVAPLRSLAFTAREPLWVWAAALILVCGVFKYLLFWSFSIHQMPFLPYACFFTDAIMQLLFLSEFAPACFCSGVCRGTLSTAFAVFTVHEFYYPTCFFFNGRICRKWKIKPLPPLSYKNATLGEPGWLSWLKHLTLDFGSSHDLRVVRSSPILGSTLSKESAWDSSSPSLSAHHHPCSRMHTLKINESFKRI